MAEELRFCSRCESFIFTHISEKPMVKINGKVQYLSTGTSMLQAGDEVDYPKASDPDFDKLNITHLPNIYLSNLPTPHNLYLRLLCGFSLVLGAAALVIAFTVLNVASLGTAGGIAFAVCGGIGFFGDIFLVASRSKNSDDNQLALEGMSL